MSPSLVTFIGRLALLAPAVATVIMRGQAPPGLTARQLMNGPPPLPGARSGST